MIAVLKGDIVGSRQEADAGRWLKPLKKQLQKYGRSPGTWEIVWGDTFQLELDTPAAALLVALQLQACVRSISLSKPIGLRIAIGIGEKTYAAKRISESNGPAYVNAGVVFEKLLAEKSILAIQSPWTETDEALNLMLSLANLQISNWSLAAAELMSLILAKPELTQIAIGEQLGIDQSSVSGRWQRASGSEIMELEQYFSKIINAQLICFSS